MDSVGKVSEQELCALFEVLEEKEGWEVRREGCLLQQPHPFPPSPPPPHFEAPPLFPLPPPAPAAVFLPPSL